jgi:hypothetical protein
MKRLDWQKTAERFAPGTLVRSKVRTMSNTVRPGMIVTVRECTPSHEDWAWLEVETSDGKPAMLGTDEVARCRRQPLTDGVPRRADHR